MVQFQKKTLCIQTASRRKLCCNEPLNDKVIAGDTWLGARPVSGGDVYNVVIIKKAAGSRARQAKTARTDMLMQRFASG
jgi:hypothetical protein